MTPQPKPAPRGRKAPKPIRRHVDSYGAPSARTWNLALPSRMDLRKRMDVQALALFSKVVRMRSPICQRCHARLGKEAHHLIHREVRRFRYDWTNGASLCWYCHKVVTVDSEENRRLAMELLGAEEWERRQCLKGPCKVDAGLWILALKTYRDQLLKTGVRDLPRLGGGEG